ncbi:MAG: hypothetical protein ABUT20_52265 [Bacteroidota bacterium]
MKKFILLFVLAFSAACDKDSAPESLTLQDDGCINRIVIPVTSQGALSDSDFSLVNHLFSANGINFQNFRFSRTYRDSAHFINGSFDYRSVYIIQYTNGLPIFFESLNYLFRDGVFDSFTGNLTHGTSLDTIPTLKLSRLRKLFIDDIQKFDHQGILYEDSCVHAEFGYYDLNKGVPNTNEKLVKAWHLTLARSVYPQAVYQDNAGQRIYYDNGFVSFH